MERLLDALPAELKKLIAREQYTEDTVGLSHSRVLLFRDKVLKIEDHTAYGDEAVQVMRWLEDKLPVPRVLYYGAEAGKSYLLMSRIPGHMGCDSAQMERRQELISLLVRGRSMWRSTPTAGCPRVRTWQDELALARERVEKGLITPEEFHHDAFEDEPFDTPEALLAYLESHVPAFVPVLSHGDYCLPNVMMENGCITGFIDLVHAGVKDEAMDLADCYRSLKGNYGGWFGGKVYPDFDASCFLDALDEQVDREKVRYALLLGCLL